jgi:hypothetical protein
MLVIFLKDLLERKDSIYPSSTPLPDSLVSNINRKRYLIEGSVLFNENTKKGIAFLQGSFL